MLTQAQKDSFVRDGFLVVPQVLSAEQVAFLRAFLRPLFDRVSEERGLGDDERFVFDIFSRHEELRWLLWNPTLIETLRDLLGQDFVVLREVAAHLNGFGGWHKDTSSQEAGGKKFQWEPDYLMVEAGFYLQDNCEQFGGGLDVEVGSHHEPDRFVTPWSPAWKRALKRFTKPNVESYTPAQVLSVPSRAGDLVIFDFRVNHRATPHRVAVLPPDHEKLAIFMACSRNNQHAAAYHQYISTRPSYTYLKEFAYPPDLLGQAKEHGVNLL